MPFAHALWRAQVRIGLRRKDTLLEVSLQRTRASLPSPVSVWIAFAHACRRTPTRPLMPHLASCLARPSLPSTEHNWVLTSRLMRCAVCMHTQDASQAPSGTLQQAQTHIQPSSSYRTQNRRCG